MSWQRKHRKGPDPLARRYRRALAPLHRRIFVWFGVAILLSGGVGFGVNFLIAGSARAREWETMKGFAGRRFADVWDEPTARANLTREFSELVGADVTLRDRNGTALDTVGETCNGGRHGGPADWDEFSQWQWLTIKSEAPRYPF